MVVNQPEDLVDTIQSTITETGKQTFFIINSLNMKHIIGVVLLGLLSLAILSGGMVGLFLIATNYTIPFLIILVLLYIAFALGSWSQAMKQEIDDEIEDYEEDLGDIHH